MKILVAMSGGVDSSVAAHLLKEEGHDLIGVMMKLWVDPLAPEVRRAIPTKCCSVEHIQRARSVCKTLGIPFYVMNLEEEFKKDVVDPFLADYKAGKTPNPCIECNRNIKFGQLLVKMKELNCDKLATGHYAQIKDRLHGYGLYEAEDITKDQSYYLYGLSQEQLSHVIFPLGSKKKSDVFALAHHFKISIDDEYRESQDLCFYPEKDPTSFLKRYITNLSRGPIVDQKGVTVGEHKGLPFYTIGQRKGLNIGGLRIPLYVERKDPSTNTIFVAEDGKDKKSIIQISDIRLISSSPDISSLSSIKVRTSSLGTLWNGSLSIRGDCGVFTFTEPVRGLAEGQSIVFYSNNEVLGGGVMC
ncbi:MAG: tRNA 2-thiouridine(34) synthase MnmA [bacterium]|nr:tRNA 2-thiouridine(34) synthase MnmA [bacterium]